MTKREKQKLRAAVRTSLLRQLMSAVSIHLSIKNHHDAEAEPFALRLIRDFRRAIRSVR